MSFRVSTLHICWICIRQFVQGSIQWVKKVNFAVCTIYLLKTTKIILFLGFLTMWNLLKKEKQITLIMITMTDHHYVNINPNLVQIGLSKSHSHSLTSLPPIAIPVTGFLSNNASHRHLTTFWMNAEYSPSFLFWDDYFFFSPLMQKIKQKKINFQYIYKEV